MVASFCNECGAKLKAEEKFCSSCGKAVGAEVTPAVEQPINDTTQQTPEIKPLTTPTKEEKNKLIALMILSIFIPIVGIIFAIIMYNKKDKQSGMHYLLCGLSGILLGITSATIDYVGWLIGLLFVASAAYNGMRQINAGVISADF